MITRFGLRRVGGVLVVVVAFCIEMLFWNEQTHLRSGGSIPLWLVPSVSALALSTLLLRWRYPWTVFGVQWLYAMAAFAISGYESVAGLLIALYAVAASCRLPLARTGWALAAIPLGIDSYVSAVDTGGPNQALNLAGIGLVWATVSGAAWGGGRLSYAAVARARRQHERHEAQAAAALQAERRRLARELHDIVSHAVSAMVMQAAGARTLVGRQDEQVARSLEVIQDAGVQAMVELHRMLGLLRAVETDLDDPGYDQQPSLAEADSLIELARASGLIVEWESDGTPVPIDRSVDLAAYRVIQEALTNVAKHAGRGAQVHVQLHWRADGLSIAIRDTTSAQRPSPPATPGLAGGHGILGLTERVALVGGHLQTGPVAGGFLVTADLPATTRGSQPPVTP